MTRTRYVLSGLAIVMSLLSMVVSCQTERRNDENLRQLRERSRCLKEAPHRRKAMTMPIETIISELTQIVAPTEQGKDALVAAEKRLKELARLIGAVSQYNTSKRSLERSHAHMHLLLADFGAV